MSGSVGSAQFSLSSELELLGGAGTGIVKATTGVPRRNRGTDRAPCRGGEEGGTGCAGGAGSVVNGLRSRRMWLEISATSSGAHKAWSNDPRSFSPIQNSRTRGHWRRRRRASWRSSQALRFAASLANSASVRGSGSGARSNDEPLETLDRARDGGRRPEGPAPDAGVGAAGPEKDTDAGADVGAEGSGSSGPPVALVPGPRVWSHSLWRWRRALSALRSAMSNPLQGKAKTWTKTGPRWQKLAPWLDSKEWQKHGQKLASGGKNWAPDMGYGLLIIETAHPGNNPDYYGLLIIESAHPGNNPDYFRLWIIALAHPAHLDYGLLSSYPYLGFLYHPNGFISRAEA